MNLPLDLNKKDKATVKRTIRFLYRSLKEIKDSNLPYRRKEWFTHLIEYLNDNQLLID